MADEASENPCRDPGSRQFDFWLGEWDVHGPAGELVGRNTISAVVNGCGLREEWRGVRGLVGTSLSTWSAQRRSWHQTWIDSSGTLLLLDGGLRDDAMVLEGVAPLPDGQATLRHRISWSLVDADPDHVRQHWETSEDGGAWETAFDGHYRRSAPLTDAGAS